MARSEAKNKVAKSLWLTCSGLLKKDAAQNRTIAPPMRKSVTTRGVIAPLAMMTLEMGDNNPHIALAPNMEA